MKDKYTGTILITGGKGFIGSHLSIWLAKLGFKIVIVDIPQTRDLFSVGASNYFNYYRTITQVADNEIFKNIEIIKLDLKTKNLSRSKLKKYRVDLCIHLASVVGVQNVMQHETPTRDSIDISINVLDFVKANNIPVVFASTSEIFGVNPNINDNSIASIPTISDSRRGGYASQKLVSEFLFMEYHKSIGLRFFNMTGKGQEVSSGMVLPTIIQRVNHQCDFKLSKANRTFSDIESFHIKLMLLKTITLAFENKNNYNWEGFNKVINIGIAEDMLKNEDNDFSLSQTTYQIYHKIYRPNRIHGYLNYSDFMTKFCLSRTNVYQSEILDRKLKETPELIKRWISKDEYPEFYELFSYKNYLDNLIESIQKYQTALVTYL